MSLHDFFAMGGYAFYVWMSYGICFVVLLANVVLTRIKHRQFLRQLSQKEKRHSV